MKKKEQEKEIFLLFFILFMPLSPSCSLYIAYCKLYIHIGQERGEFDV